MAPLFASDFNRTIHPVARSLFIYLAQSAATSALTAPAGAGSGRIERAFGIPWRLGPGRVRLRRTAQRTDAVGTFVSGLFVALLAAWLSHVFHWV